MTLLELKAFLGWCSILNFGLLLVSALVLVLFADRLVRLHAALFQMDPADLRRLYLQSLAFYKVLILTFNIVPYVALVILT
ncbi:DUF6868 family protein [Roseibium suaedae]|uniref:DUF6868 domain-containing protein n=1 Tax=Roseibium suaedae TaxID=735517 RepID=A0A1M7GP80_9HYPH|nr:hypothetical protein [Roseibium suaedae]SHM17958.1 hypothetical protein SAMN05444272_1978 [Roseibium suaedae]